jgi:hypothetical protein
VSIAFGYTGDLQIEIVHQQNAAPSGYLDFLAEGREGAHHISSFYDRPGYEAAYARIVAADLPLLHEGNIGGIRFAYFATERSPGSMICELSESDMEMPKQLFDGMRAAAATWDGSDPMRALVV